MSSPNKTQTGDSEPRSTRSTRSNTSVPDNIVHVYVSERKQGKTNRQIPKEIPDSSIEREEEAVTSSQASTEGPGETETIKSPDARTVDRDNRDNEETLKEEIAILGKGIRELELTVEEVLGSQVAAQTPPAADITLQNKTPRPDTPTTHIVDEINDSDNESTCTIVENLSQEDISKYISFDTDKTPFDHTVEHYFTPEEFAPDSQRPLTGFEAVKRTLFTINGSVPKDTTTNPSDSRTNDNNIGETPKHGFSNKPITPLNTEDSDDDLDDTITDKQDTVKKPEIKMNTKQETPRDTPKLPPVRTVKTEMANSSLRVSLKDALAVVPTYDGATTSLSMFIQGCEEALEMLDPGSEAHLVKAVRIKIIGEPRRSIMQQTFENMRALHKFLKCIYAPARNIYQLQGELGSIYQRPNETVVAYSNRIRDLGYQILDAYESENDAPADEAFVRNTKNSLPLCFVQGLKSEIEQRMTMEGSIDDIVKRAVKIEKQLIARKALREGIRDSADSKEATVGAKRSIKAISFEEVKCQLCNKLGHEAGVCPEKKPVNAQVASTTTPSDPPKIIPTCQVCSKKGHSADRCFKLFPPMNSKPLNETPTITVCQVCNKRGHTADKCYRLFPPSKQNTANTTFFCQLCKNRGHGADTCPIRPTPTGQQSQTQKNTVPQGLQFQQTADIKCQICKRNGHGAYICPYRHNQAQCENSKQPTYSDAVNNGSKQIGNCHYCRQPGHFIRECPAKQANDARYGNSSGNANGLSTTGASGATAQQTHPIHTISAVATSPSEA